MKLTTMTQVTVDGVMQGNGGASDEDRRNGFERGGWAMGVADNETMTFINQTYQRADAFLFGRRTYELFAGYWGAEERARAALEDPGNHQIAAALDGFARVNAAICTARGSLSQVKSASRSPSANVRSVIAIGTARRSCLGAFNE